MLHAGTTHNEEATTKKLGGLLSTSVPTRCATKECLDSRQTLGKEQALHSRGEAGVGRRGTPKECLDSRHTELEVQSVENNVLHLQHLQPTHSQSTETQITCTHLGFIRTQQQKVADRRLATLMYVNMNGVLQYVTWRHLTMRREAGLGNEGVARKEWLQALKERRGGKEGDQGKGGD